MNTKRAMPIKSRIHIRLPSQEPRVWRSSVLGHSACASSNKAQLIQRTYGLISYWSSNGCTEQQGGDACYRWHGRATGSGLSVKWVGRTSSWHCLDFLLRIVHISCTWRAWTPQALNSKSRHQALHSVFRCKEYSVEASGMFSRLWRNCSVWGDQHNLYMILFSRIVNTI